MHSARLRGVIRPEPGLLVLRTPFPDKFRIADSLIMATPHVGRNLIPEESCTFRTRTAALPFTSDAITIQAPMLKETYG